MSDGQHKNKTVLGPDCRISGELALDNDAVIMGRFNGTLRVSGMLEVTDSAQLQGTLIVGTLRLAGHVEADVVAEEGVELLPGSQLNGQVYTSRLNVVEGAVFQGDVCIGPKAMQAAGEALQQQPIADASHGDEQDDMDFDPQMIEEAEAVEQAQAQAHAQAQPQPQASMGGQPNVKTMPQSVDAILQRRRPKVLAAGRKPMMSAGNGQR